jgi:hypothetical protein
MHTKQS